MARGGRGNGRALSPTLLSIPCPPFNGYSALGRRSARPTQAARRCTRRQVPGLAPRCASRLGREGERCSWSRLGLPPGPRGRPSMAAKGSGSGSEVPWAAAKGNGGRGWESANEVWGVQGRILCSEGQARAIVVALLVIPSPHWAEPNPVSRLQWPCHDPSLNLSLRDPGSYPERLHFSWLPGGKMSFLPATGCVKDAPGRQQVPDAPCPRLLIAPRTHAA
jgi:hypothetical protein